MVIMMIMMMMMFKTHSESSNTEMNPRDITTVQLITSTNSGRLFWTVLRFQHENCWCRFDEFLILGHGGGFLPAD